MGMIGVGRQLSRGGGQPLGSFLWDYSNARTVDDQLSLVLLIGTKHEHAKNWSRSPKQSCEVNSWELGNIGGFHVLLYSHSINYLTYLSVGSFLKYPYLLGKTPISMDSQYWGRGWTSQVILQIGRLGDPQTVAFLKRLTLVGLPRIWRIPYDINVSICLIKIG